MAKVKIRDLSEKERIETLDALYTAASVLKGRKAMKAFLRDLLTSSERVMLGRRILIARRIIAGDSMLDISASMRVGLDTVSKVDRWLNDQFPGYEVAIEGLEKEEVRRRKPKYPEWGTFAYLKKKYPLHFLLFPPFNRDD